MRSIRYPGLGEEHGSFYDLDTMVDKRHADNVVTFNPPIVISLMRANWDLSSVCCGCSVVSAPASHTAKP